MTAVPDLRLLDVIGFLAGAMTVSTFALRAAIPMRITALCANACFITYAAMGGFLPILTLHTILVPVNAVRLAQAVRLKGRYEIPSLAQSHEPLPAAPGVSFETAWGDCEPILHIGLPWRATGLFAAGLALAAALMLPAALLRPPLPLPFFVAMGKHR